MQSTQGSSLVMPSSTGDKVRLVVLVLGAWAVLFAVTHLLGVSPVIGVVLSVLFTSPLWWRVFVVFTSSPPALTTEGVRLRNGRADSLVPWSEVTSLGLVPVSRMSRMYLEVATSNAKQFPGPGKEGVNYVYLSPAMVTPEQVREAVARLTEGRLVVRDEPYRRTLSA
jgi:hypothetical protein